MLLSSVHSFASDPTRGFFILVLIALAIGGALALFAWRAPTLQGGAAFSPVSRETTLLLNNVFLVAACACVFVGTLYPLVLDAINGTKISVGPALLRADLRADLLRAFAVGAAGSEAGMEARRSQSAHCGRYIPRWDWPLSRLWRFWH